jgi:hypothetical protein
LVKTTGILSVLQDTKFLSSLVKHKNN